MASATVQFGADAIPQAALLNRLSKWWHVRQLPQDEAQFGAAIASIERGIEAAQNPREAVALLDKVIELGVAARNRRRLAANLIGKRRADAREPALKLAPEPVDSVRVDCTGRCRMRHDYVGWVAAAGETKQHPPRSRRHDARI